MSTSAATTQPASYQVDTQRENRALKQKLGNFFQKIFLFCTGQQDVDGEEGVGTGSTVLQISYPTNFRREEINIPGMTMSQECFIREKARHDAERMFSKLQPLTSSPSGEFAERPNQMPTYEQFVEPRVAPQSMGRLSRMVAHTRKISEGLRGSSNEWKDGKGEMEMSSLTIPGGTQVGEVEAGKLSEESLKSRDRDGESAKGLVGIDAKL